MTIPMKKSVKSLDSGMASAGERVQKLSAEAFSRLRNDHEQFLEAYESELSRFSWSLALLAALFGGERGVPPAVRLPSDRASSLLPIQLICRHKDRTCPR